MDIVVTFDDSTASAPSWYFDAVNAVAQAFDNEFTNDITVPISFGWGSVNGHTISGGLAASGSSFDLLDYDTLKSAFAQGSQVSQVGAGSMPADDPTNGGIFKVPLSLEKALGLVDGNADDGRGEDGWVGLNSNANWNPNIGSPPSDGQFDPFGELEHEVTEVMGRIGYVGAQNAADGQALYGPMDLYRWSYDTNQRDPSNPAGYFSVRGDSNQQDFNNPQNGGDAADWAPSIQGDSFGSAYTGMTAAFTSTDATVMRALGYTAPSNAIVNG